MHDGGGFERVDRGGPQEELRADFSDAIRGTDLAGANSPGNPRGRGECEAKKNVS